MTTLSHQDIIDRREALGKRRSVAFSAEQARIAQKQAENQRACAGLGHFYAHSGAVELALLSTGGRHCLFCGASEQSRSEADVGSASRANEHLHSADCDAIEGDPVLAKLEADLTEIARDVVEVLRSAAISAELVRMEIPIEAHFCEGVARSIVHLSYQLSEAILKSTDRRIFFDDGVSYLEHLGLSCQEFLREIDLDGRRYLAIALADSSFNKVETATEAGD